MKSQTPSTKLQTSTKFQAPRPTSPGRSPGGRANPKRFGHLNFGHWDLFGIWDLGFGISQRGQAVLISVFIVFMILVAVVLGFSILTISRSRIAQQGSQSERAFSVAEAGLEDAMVRLMNLKNLPASYTLNVGTDGQAAITVANPTSTTRLITSTGTVGNVSRKLQITTGLSSHLANFYYGVQVAAGGVQMENNSEIRGSLYSNGTLMRVSGGQPITVTGDVFVSSGKIENIAVGGNAAAPTIDAGTVAGNASASVILDGTNVTGNVTAAGIKACTIAGNAAYNTEGSPACTISGTRTSPNPSPPSPPAALPLPISQEQIDSWKAEAEAGGTISGSVSLDGITNSLGPVKITGNLTVTNNAVLTMTGTIWVQGNILADNGAVVQLHSNYGGLSGVILADGWIKANNNGQLRGSGDPASYLMALTTLACVGSPAPGCGDNNAAIIINNNVLGAIFYAQNGLIWVRNNVLVRELTGWGIYLNNNAILEYEAGLASIEFTKGPSGGWEIRGWQEIP